MYVSGKGKMINSDINGSLNIIRKAHPEFVSMGTEGLAVNPDRGKWWWLYQPTLVKSIAGKV